MTSTDITNFAHRTALPFHKATATVKAVFPLGLEARIILMILAVLSLWALAIMTFGVPALIWPMTVIVPTLVLSLVLLTWGM